MYIGNRERRNRYKIEMIRGEPVETLSFSIKRLDQGDVVAVVTGAVVWVVVTLTADVVGFGDAVAVVLTAAGVVVTAPVVVVLMGVAVITLTRISTVPMGAVVASRVMRAPFL